MDATDDDRRNCVFALEPETETSVLTIARADVGELYRKRGKKEELQTCCKDVLALLALKIMCFNCHPLRNSSSVPEDVD